MRHYLPFLGLLALLLILVRDDTLLLVFYLLAGVYAASYVWSRRALQAVQVQRRFASHAFPGEAVPVTVRLTNASLLPVIWLRAQDSVPPGLGALVGPSILSLGARASTDLTYTLHPYRRGQYAIGPLYLNSGDVLGLTPESARQAAPEPLIVYPHIVLLPNWRLPSRSPLGTLRHTQPLFADPTRPIGKRDYATGDSLRHVDWKASATQGRLQVKHFAPSIALEAMLALDLRAESYRSRTRIDDTELAITVAASIANAITRQRQAVGLFTNGEGTRQTHPARKGQHALIHLLETLACVQLNPNAALVPLWLRHATAPLAWGTTLVLITGHLDEAILETLLHARRAGLTLSVVAVGNDPTLPQWRGRFQQAGCGFSLIARESDLQSWTG